MSLKKILLMAFIIIAALYFFQLWRVAHNYSQSYSFGDENAHMAGGYLLLKGFAPYRDFAVNHQPLVYYFSAVVQQVFRPNTLYQFIGRHHDAIFAYSAGWNILYLLVFGPITFFFTATFEVMRYIMLGNKVLGEPLAVYPLVMIFGLAIKRLLFRKELAIWEIVLFAASTFTVAFSLLPLWPTIVILNGLLFISYWKQKQKIAWQLLTIAVLTATIFLFVPFKEYFRETFVENYTYVIPHMNMTKLVFPDDYLRMIFLPLTSFHASPNFIEVMAIGFLPLYAFMVYLVKKQKKLLSLLAIILALVLANNRTYALKAGNFHVLPWIGIYFAIPILYFSQLINSLSKSVDTFFEHLRSRRAIAREWVFLNAKKTVSSFLIIGWLFILATWLNFFSRDSYYGNILLDLHNNLKSEHYINYTDSAKYGLGIKAIGQPTDRLIGLPNDTLVFWTGNINLATRPLENYDWQYDMPEYKTEVYDVFNHNPPEFYLATELNPLTVKSPLHQFVLKNLDSKYVRINHLGHESSLYILKSKLPAITDKQWRDFQYLLFEKPIL